MQVCSGTKTTHGCFPKIVVPPKHHKMTIFSRKTPWLLGTTILHKPYMDVMGTLHTSMGLSPNHILPHPIGFLLKNNSV